MTSKIHMHTGIILAGGKSTRMGQDKGLKLHNGLPFIHHIIKALTSVTNTIYIITNTIAYQKFDLPCIPDSIPNKGPIGGIYTGLMNSKTDKNFILSCDVPFITIDTLYHLDANYKSDKDVTYFEQTPLVGIYSKSCTATFLDAIKKDHLSLTKVISELKINCIPVPENLASTMYNINTQEQYQKAKG